MTQFKNHIFYSVALLFSAWTIQVQADCTLSGKQSSPNLVPSTIVASLTSHVWDFIDQNRSLNVIPIQDCSAVGTLQISKIAVNCNPEDYRPQIYDSTKIHLMPETCSIDSDLDRKVLPTEHYDQYVKLSAYVNQCIGVEIDSANQLPIVPMPSATCEFRFVDSQKTKVIAKGENCQIAKPKGSYMIQPVYLESCASTDIAKSGIANLEATLTILQTDKDATALATKNVQMVVNADLSSQLQVVKTTYRSPKFEMLRPSDYNIDIDFAQISLTGSSKTKVTASAKYFIQNKSECKSDSCLSASSYRTPLVVENDLYLAKANNINERIFLGRWYNASVVPAQWAGVDGSPATNAIVFNWNSIQLNSSFSQAEKGDSLVLVSHLVNPNRGIKSYITAGNQYLQGQHKVESTTLRSDTFAGMTSGFGAIGGMSQIAPLPALKFKNIIPELDFNSVINGGSLQDLDAGKLWLVRYSRYCSQANVDNCEDLGEISDLVTIETEIKITKLDETGLEVQPIETLKNSSISQNSYDLKLTKPTKIQCLKPEITNTDLKLRSRK